MFLTFSRSLFAPLLISLSIFATSNGSHQQQGKDTCHVYVVDVAKAERVSNTVPRTDDKEANEKAGLTIFPEFQPTIGEEELTTKHYRFPGTQRVITASVFYTDESLASHGHGEFASHSESMLIGVTVSKHARQSAIDASAGNAITEVTYDQYTNKVRAKKFITLGGRVYLVGIECDCMANQRRNNGR
jgi:hypothetical protein